MSNDKTNLDKADDSMNQPAHLPVVIVYGLVALIVLPFALSSSEVHNISKWMPLIMALGPLLAGLWLLIEPKIGKDQYAYTIELPSRVTVVVTSCVIAVATWLVATLVFKFGNQSADGYLLMKDLGLVTGYAIGGLLPVVAFIVFLKIIMVKRINVRSSTSVKLRLRTWNSKVTIPTVAILIVCFVLTMLAPWFWASYKYALDYGVL